jgi:hypothetical protein
MTNINFSIDLYSLKKNAEEEMAENTTATYDQVIEKRIQDIMDEFDFDKVHRVMEMLEWKWASAVESGDDIPTKPELRRFARNFLKECAERKESASTGGFSVDYREGVEYETKWVNLNLTFQIAHTMFDGDFYIDEVPN